MFKTSRYTYQEIKTEISDLSSLLIYHLRSQTCLHCIAKELALPFQYFQRGVNYWGSVGKYMSIITKCYVEKCIWPVLGQCEIHCQCKGSIFLVHILGSVTRLVLENPCRLKRNTNCLERTERIQSYWNQSTPINTVNTQTSQVN